MKGIDTLPPGPLLRDYDFRVTYYEQPIDEMYRSTITGRLMAGMPPLMAVKGTPITVEKAKRWRKHLKLTYRDEKRHYKFVGKQGYDGYDVIMMFYEQKMSMREIAKNMKCSVGAIHKALHQMGVDDAKEFRRKNPSHSQKKNIEITCARLRKQAQMLKHSPGYKKYKYFIKKKGDKYLPLYNDIVAGVPIGVACKKHGISYRMAKYYFTKFQKLDDKFLEYGKIMSYPLKITKAQWLYWEKASKRQGINVLDWIKKHLNAAAQQDARDKSGDNGSKAGNHRVLQAKDTGGEVRTVLQGVRSVHERPEEPESGRDCAGIEDGAGCAHEIRPEQGLGADAVAAKVDNQHGSEREAHQHSQAG